tara:strand:+ start:2682 stop:2846 length:165 start_codon:yes stop_codon:yes gene_type:complete
MKSYNWILRNLMIKKTMLKDTGIDVRPLDDETKVNAAFKMAGLKFPVRNNGGIA